MDFTITSEVVDKVAKLKLTGELDSLSARFFKRNRKSSP